MHFMEPSSLNKHALSDRDTALHYDMCALMIFFKVLRDYP